MNGYVDHRQEMSLLGQVEPQDLSFAKANQNQQREMVINNNLFLNGFIPLMTV